MFTNCLDHGLVRIRLAVILVSVKDALEVMMSTGSKPVMACKYFLSDGDTDTCSDSQAPTFVDAYNDMKLSIDDNRLNKYVRTIYVLWDRIQHLTLDFSSHFSFHNIHNS